MTFAINLATHVRGLIKLSHENDERVDADIAVDETGFDPVKSARLTITPKVAEPFTCHLLFPEIVLDTLPSRVTLGIEVNSPDTNVVFDGADRNGPCVALPVYRGGTWAQGSSFLDMSKPYMVWKEGRERLLQPPIRIKYLLIMSMKGGPIDVVLRDITIES